MRRLIVLVLAAACSSPQTSGAPAPQSVASNLSDDRRLALTFGLMEDARIAAMLRDVDPARIRVYDSTLVAFGTRNTYSDSLSATRGSALRRSPGA